jgi:NAD(P)H-hydrate repair Nnr-like enzyme with NAD(P)H-hydrate dehydratase domain
MLYWIVASLLLTAGLALLFRNADRASSAPRLSGIATTLIGAGLVLAGVSGPVGDFLERGL